MDLYIKSQDEKHLTKYNDHIWVCGNQIRQAVMQGCVVLGKYKTEERAKEVLDRIMKEATSKHAIMPTSNYGMTDTSHFDIDMNKRYQMPKE